MSDLRRHAFQRTLAAAAVLILSGTGGRALAQVDSADDICASNANPCNVTQVFDIEDGAVLDFGIRAVNVSGAGQFNFGPGSGSILCGNFTASTTNPAINANGPAAGGGSQSGRVEVLARRTCSAGATTKRCVDLADCQLGACDTRRCSLKPSKVCTGESQCQLGPCNLLTKRCSAATNFVRCTSDVDCDYGTCPQQLTCKSQISAPTNCSQTSDCDFGTCSVGNASITMGGSIVGNSDSPASIFLRAGDSVSISKLVNLVSSSLESDGGDLTVQAGAGSVTLSEKVNATGGGDSQGGTVEISAGLDVTISDEINVVGGDFDGGSVEIDAGRDIVLGRSLIANSSLGAGFGGDVLLEADRHLTINGVSPSNKTNIETNGHTDIENFAGDGGTQDLSSVGNMTINVNTRLLGTGSIPDGYGSDITLEADGNITLNGDITARSDGDKGSGGFVDVLSEGKLTVGSTGTFDLTGGDGGGILEFAAGTNADFGGFSDVSGSPGGSAFLDSGDTTTVSGTMFVSGNNGGTNEVDGCRVLLTASANLDSNVVNGDNLLVARESMKLLAGSQMTTGLSGSNTLRYRTNAKPPIRSGAIITPDPVLVVDPTLGAVYCAVCGNSEEDFGESCDDGNTVNGDGCNSDCQNEKCVQQTQPAPQEPTPLCNDNNFCTTDTCNTALNGGTCQHPAKSCADAFACTTDTCNVGLGTCQHAPNDAACNDANVCTDDFCSVTVGCDKTNNNDSCPDGDGNVCTENDTCVGGSCQGTQIPGCGFCGDGNVNNPPEQCDDGNATFTAGEYCGVNCVLIPCGKPTNSSGEAPKASDAQFTLRSAVGQIACSKRVCDVNNNDRVTSTDSLQILRKAVGQQVTLTCPAA